MVVVVANF